MTPAPHQNSGVAADKPVYTTVVVRHVDEKAARAFCGEIMERFPMFADAAPSTASVGIGDRTSCIEAAQMVLEAGSILDQAERIELASSLLEALSWETCLGIMSEWELEFHEGAIREVDASDEQ